MDWIYHFQLFLFDFDGLLVDTERLHFAAYRHVLGARGFNLDWDFEQFCRVAHVHPEGLKEAIYAQFPLLYTQEPRWEVLYAEKKRSYLELLRSGSLALMPGVAELLHALAAANIKRAVATHSPREQVDQIKATIPLLKTIPVWVTREDYLQPKPAPDAYLKALELLAAPGDRIIGFEDSIRGLRALQGTPATAVLICPPSHPQLQGVKGALHFSTLAAIPAGAFG